VRENWFSDSPKHAVTLSGALIRGQQLIFPSRARLPHASALITLAAALDCRGFFDLSRKIIFEGNLNLSANVLMVAGISE
jgi:hypothetical protein